MMKEKESCDSHEQTPEKKTGFLQFTAIVKSHQDATAMIEQLSAQKIIACAQIQKPHTGDDGRLDQQWYCRFKSSEALLPRLRNELNFLLKRDDYELNISPIVRGSDSFLQWLQSALTSS